MDAERGENLMRRQLDEIDLWCGGWAATRRMIHGIRLADNPDDPRYIGMLPEERIGKLRCTLGAVKEDREGAHSAGVVSQNWPEVYKGMSLVIHRCWLGMPSGTWKLVMDAHYVWREIPVKIKAPEIGIKVDAYWDQLNLLKAYLYGAVRNHPDKDEFVPKSEPLPSFTRAF